jgi:hypothetical protein
VTIMPSLSRRNFLKIVGIASSVSVPSICLAQASASTELSLDELLKEDIISEPQFGDPLGPDDKFETLTLRRPSQQKAVGDDPVFDKKDPEQLCLQMLKITRKFVEDGVSRDNKVDQLLELLNVLDYTKKETPFCAAGVSYAACRAYCDLAPKPEAYGTDINTKRINHFKSKLTTIYAHYFFPSGLVRVIKAAAIKKGNWVDRSVTPLPGWPVIFSWDGTSAGNHIGLVESAKKEDSLITTLEYNTTVVVDGNQRDGGHVARKNRPKDKRILGYVKLYPNT